MSRSLFRRKQFASRVQTELEREVDLEQRALMAFNQLKQSYFLLGDSIDLEVSSGEAIHRFIRDSFFDQKHRLRYNRVDNDAESRYYTVIVYLGNLNPGKPLSFLADFQTLVGESLTDFSIGGEASTRGGVSSGLPCLMVFNYR